MALLVELPPEMEEQLREKAAARGLTAEGYLLTLIESLVQPITAAQKPQSPLRRALSRLIRKETQEAPASDEIVGEALRLMRQSVLQYKEQAVEAVTTVNMLRTAVEQQERLAAEKELQALCVLREEDTQQAKRLWQQKTILDKHVEIVKQELAAASEVAAAITQVFQQEEQRTQVRVEKAQTSALKAYRKAVLSPNQITHLIGRLRTEAQWNQAFEQWLSQKRQPTNDSQIQAVAPGSSLEAFTQIAEEWAKEARKKPKMPKIK